jgi:seryl-tRNA synthetase
MLDVREIEANPEGVKAALSRRGEVPHLDEVLALAAERKALIAALQKQQEERNVINDRMKGAAKDEIEARRAEMKTLSSTIKDGERAVSELEEKLNGLLLLLPNIPHESVPDGKNEESNVEVARHGTPRAFAFKPKDHVDLGTALDIIDSERAAKVSGARFTYLKGAGAKLNRALVSFMLDHHLAQGDLEMWTPYLVSRKSMTNTGQLPKFEADAFRLQHGDDDLFLIPTAEVSLTNYYADEILDEENLPLRLIAHTPCFRAEAGSAGRDTRGLIRQHQFDKVEMVRFSTPEQAFAELDLMVGRASAIMTALELPHRVVLLCAGDMGAGAEKTFDLEVWLPSQDTYREISSCSSCGTYQARRGMIRYRPLGDGVKRPKPKPLVTLNGSGLAVGRTLIALLENHQQEDGTITIPKALVPYMGGVDRIVPRA